MSAFRIIRVFVYPVAALVFVAYGMATWGVYAYVADLWPTDDPRMLIPGAGCFALYPGLALAAFLLAYRHRLHRFERWVFTSLCLAGLLLFPLAYSCCMVLGW